MSKLHSSSGDTPEEENVQVVGATSRKEYLIKLHQILATRFDEGELRTLCFDLGIDYDNLPDDGKANQARELVAYLGRRGRISELVRRGKELRPDIPWDETLGMAQEPPSAMLQSISPDVVPQSIPPEQLPATAPDAQPGSGGGLVLGDICPLLSGKYTVERELGKGGGGHVCLAQDELGRQVALKYHKAFTADDQHQIERLLQEARTVASLRHSNVAIVYTTESHPESGDYCVVMEYADGGTLAHLLKAEGRFSLERALDIGIQVCTALEYVHRMELIHRDIKPSNILFFRTDDQVVAKIADFGLSRGVQVGDHRLEEQEGQFSGTWEYAAPELWQEDIAIDKRADLYSLGVVLYEMLVGKPPFPFSGDVAAVVFGHLHGDITPPQEFRPAVFDELNALVLKALAKLPSERFQDAGMMLSALRQARDLCTQYHKRAQDSYDRGMRLEEKEDWPKAVKAFEEAYALNPELEGTEPRLKNAQRMQELETTWREMEALWADEVWADVLEKLGRIGKLAPEYRAKEVEEKAKHARLQLKLASLYGDARAAEGAGQRREAIGLYVKIVSLDDRYSDAAQRLARLRTEEDLENLWTQGEQLVQQDKWEEATEVYVQILEKDPDYPGAAKQLSHTRRQLELARLYSQALAGIEKKDWGKTIEILREITTHEPAYKDAAIRLADVSRRQRLELLRQSVEQFMEGHQWSDAATALEELCRFEPTNEEAQQQLKLVRQWQAFDNMYRRGKADYDVRQWDEAIVKLEEALKIAKTADLDLHNYRDIRPLLDQAKKNKELDALREKGKQLEAGGDFNSLIQVLDRILARDRTNQEVRKWKESALQQIRLRDLYDEALLRLDQKDWVGAKRLLDEIASVDAEYKDTKEIRMRAALSQDISRVRRWGLPLLIVLGVALLVLFVPRLVAEARSQLDLGSLAVTPELVGTVVSVLTLIISMAGLLIPAEKIFGLLERDKRLRICVVVMALLVAVCLLILMAAAFVSVVKPHPETSTPKPLTLCNGGFESGFECWEHGGELRQDVKCEGGQCFAVLGKPGYKCEGGVPVGDAWIKQSFQVPQAVSPTLSLRYCIFSYDLEKYDSFQVSINDQPVGQFGNTDWEKSDCDREVWDSGWRSAQFDLSAYSGQTITVALRNVNGMHEWWNTWTHVDDVEIR